MSIFSDHECGALSDFEFDQECRRMNRQDRYEREHLYDDPDYPNPESEEMETEQDQAYTESYAESDDISHIFDNVTQEEFEKIAKELTGWDTENIRKKIQGKRMPNEEAIAILEEEAEFLYGEDKPHNRTAFDMAIKALSVLKKLRAEIENIPNDDTTKPIGTYDYCMGAENERKLILSIIDKYIGGKE